MIIETWRILSKIYGACRGEVLWKYVKNSRWIEITREYHNWIDLDEEEKGHQVWDYIQYRYLWIHGHLARWDLAITQGREIIWVYEKNAWCVSKFSLTHSRKEFELWA